MKRDVLKVIAACELLGGALVVGGWGSLPVMGFRLDPAWQGIPPILFGALAIAAGALLYREHRLGVPVSIAVQALQLVSVSVASRFRYVALAGPIAQVIVATTGVRLEIGGGGLFVAVPWSEGGALDAPGVHLAVGAGYQPGTLADSGFTMAVNLAAFYFLWRLLDFVGERSDDARALSST